MLRFGFIEWWMRSVAALYSSASSFVLMVGDKGSTFHILRSVRQGCPLAPFLFISFAETLHILLTAEVVGVKGLTIPVTPEQEVLDAEFADDTGLYLHDSLENLVRTKLAICVFCQTSGARINWHKTVGFWVGPDNPPNWSLDPYFRWISKGTTIRYLGCQVGLEVSSDGQIAPLLLTIRRKLLYWCSVKLSLAGHAIIVNQVLLSTMWCILSCWIFSKPCINQVRRLIRNYLWSGKIVDRARANVAWTTITMPKSAGGLGIIDPAHQSKALLAKLVVRSLLPMDEIWKKMLINRMTQELSCGWQTVERRTIVDL